MTGVSMGVAMGHRDCNGGSPSGSHVAVDLADQWIVDSGTCAHIMGIGYVADPDERLLTSKEPMVVSTANGTLEMPNYVNSLIPGLGASIMVNIAKSSPAALSLGKLCKDLGYEFHWKPFT